MIFMRRTICYYILWFNAPLGDTFDIYIDELTDGC